MKRFRLLHLTAMAVFVVLLATAFYAGMRWDLSKSDWAAWIQAVGSVGAILVAIAVVQLQHARESRRHREIDRAARRSQLSVLLWLFNVIADTCNSIASMVGGEHVAWNLQAQVIRERRIALIAVPVAAYPDPALLLRALDLSHRLQLVAAVVEALNTPRKATTQEHIADMLYLARDDALVGVTEATNLLASISSEAEMKNEWKLLDAREENRRLAMKVWAEISGITSTEKSDAGKDVA